MGNYKSLAKSLPVFFSACLYFSVHAQDSTNTIGRVSISSPNAASLGKYGDVPVSYHTGIPDISIPIYTVKSGKLSLPVSLSYHASGLKVQEQAGWVGAGWSLNAGGMITRTVRGAADDRGYNNGYVTHGYYSDSGYFNYSMHIDGSVPPSTGTNGMGPDDEGILAGRKDGEPDLFTFNVGGKSGKFYFNDDRSPVLVPDDDLKIETDFALGHGFKGFIITTAEGDKYYFGETGNYGSVDPVEVTYFMTTQSTYGLSGRVASSWFLNKIVSADGIDSIVLNYQQESYSYYNISMFPLYYQGYNQYVSAGGYLSGFYPYEYDLLKNYIQGVRLSSITFPNGTVTFNAAASARTDLAGYTDQTMNDQANTEAKALASIQISNTGGSFCKKFNFFYNYFVDNTNGLNGLLFQNNYPALLNTHSDKYRLRLDSIQELTCDNAVKLPPYKFDYFSELVPRKLSFGIDHWGFYNGVTTNTALIPPTTILFPNTFQKYPGSNRDAAWPAMRGGSLNKITYPTGGFTQFDFEPNTTYTSFDDYVLTSRIARSAGFDGHNGILGDGGSNPDSTHLTFTGNYYRLVVTNDALGGNATLDIYFPMGTFNSVFSFSVLPGHTDSVTFTLAPGTYWLKFTKQNATSAHGASYVLSELSPTHFSTNAMVGGLRIKTITNNSGISGQNIVTSYSYNFGNSPTGQSSGILYSRPSYIQIIRNDVIGVIWGGQAGGFTNGCASPDISPTKGYYKSPSSVRPMETTQGNHIGYNEVYVSQANNGYSVYRYYGSNVWDNITTDVCKRTLIQSSTCDPNIPNYPEAPPAFECMRGELKYEGHFNEAGQLLKDVYYYPAYAQETLSTPGHIAFQTPFVASFTSYNLNTYKKIKTSVQTTLYSPSVGSATTTSTAYFSSNYHHQPTRTVTYTSAGDSMISNMKYAADFRVAGCDAQPDSVSYFLNLIHNDSVTFFNTVAVCTPQGSSTQYADWNNCRYVAFIKLRYDLSVHRTRYVKYLKRTWSNSNSLFNACYLTAKNGAGTELKPILDMQIAFQNPVIEKSDWKNNNLLHSNFTKYDYVTAPTGKVYPNKTQLINLSAVSGSFSDAAVSGTTITKDNRYTDEASYLFGTGNPLHVIPKNGVANAYVWDYLNTEPIARVSNATSDQVAYTSFESNGKGNWTFSGTPVTDATAPTGGKCYGLASGSITKSGLTSGASYVVSYWSKTGSPFTITGTPIAKQGKTINGWTYFEHIITGTTSITISGTGSIDELRLYPSTAQMTTYTYSPLMGITSECDVDNRVSYYQYDSLGRLSVVKDQDGNVIKTIDYHYQNQVGN